MESHNMVDKIEEYKINIKGQEDKLDKENKGDKESKLDSKVHQNTEIQRKEKEDNTLNIQENQCLRSSNKEKKMIKKINSQH